MCKLSKAFDVAQNLVLSSLRPADLEHLLPDLQPVTLPLGKVVYEPGERIGHCYFPTSSVISLQCSMRDGATAEMGMVGKEGVLGVIPFLGGESICSMAIVAVAGGSLRLPAKRLQQEFLRPGPLQQLLLRYTMAHITQVSQTAVCNRLHSVEQRLCRLLLLCHDRTNRAELPMTQELIASMLGGRRESVTLAAGRLQDAGLIHYCRGRILILNRAGLEAAACECYRAVEDESDRLFGRTRQPGFSKAATAFQAAC